ncbi:hypothetical protein RN22_07745 [Grimontia sp. AD028]|uniref:Diguanylate cyclase/phosphodiesterase n=1 Tax=Grimontia indica TaxID=1056512 RepID=R1ITY1_9GAMM|nr:MULTISPECIES: EAL domain-containing response regulator [Grimontia]EOD80917.1 diguanylate cyclase/phosphodiesterase [Grimontia indica]KKD61042.1 hypothetical protein RN22_07745 [Grimontia sp. AD028]
MNVYVVDDNTEFTDVITQMLCETGYPTKGYNRGMDLLRFAAPTSNDVLLLDVHMPDKNGIALLKELSSFSIKPCVILLSGYDKSILNSASTFAQSLDFNVIGSLSKPFTRRVLLNMLEFAKQGKADKKKMEVAKVNPVDVEEAMDDDQLDVFYQPQINLRDGVVTSYECLLRWHHPELGLLSADQFLHTDLPDRIKLKLSLWVLNRVASDAEALVQLPHFKSISINVSASSLVTPEYQFRFNSLIAGTQLKPHQITLELIEREFLEGRQDVLDILVNLRIKGVGLSLDDFGTGYSSLSLFHTLPFSELKVDKSFTKTMLSNAQSLNIVRSCIDLAKRMELKVIAEGVESHDIYEHLQHEWCDSAQGYYIAKPMPLKTLMSWNANFNHHIYN